VFTSAGTQGGGIETTALTAVTQFAHHGMVFVPCGYSLGERAPPGKGRAVCVCVSACTRMAVGIAVPCTPSGGDLSTSSAPSQAV
jgi:multimeric flavodoxin WrbA